jgi:hypothetical protein
MLTISRHSRAGGIQLLGPVHMRDRRDWIPACAGMTNKIKQIHCFI